MIRAVLLAVFAGIVVIGVYSVTSAVDIPSSICTIGAKDDAIRKKKPRDVSGLSVATFAGGCFWCVEAAFEAAPGVREVISGFSGGERANPTYRQVSHGLTKHTEAVQVYYDPKIITYEGLLQVLWRTADPTDSKGQFSDRGRHYRPAIFYHDEDQERTAIRAREELANSGRFEEPITIEIVAFKAFYPAEQYHQDYYLKNPCRYQLYTVGSGRAGFQEEVWGDELIVDFSKYRPRQTERQDARSAKSKAM
jgi:peptide methionine sulfoxide reductase msrA/msrB